MAMKEKINIFWFRRDLRLNDNHGLYKALNGNLPVLPVFIYDTDILKKLKRDDTRLSFIYQELVNLRATLQSLNSDLLCIHGTVQEAFEHLTENYHIQKVIANRDYEPEAISRDKNLSLFLSKLGIEFKLYKDQVIFEHLEISKSDGKPYTVFTPYYKAWRNAYLSFSEKAFPSESLMSNFLKWENKAFLSLSDIGFTYTHASFPPKLPDEGKLALYDKNRDFPSIQGTSKLGVHLRFGTISIRDLMQTAFNLNEVFFKELIWREFYMQILFNFPHVVNLPFKSNYRFIEWNNNEEWFERWKQGKTGYPLVDAGMRQLNETGYMHNRLRMLCASFLVKHLLINWQWGEAYFAEKLLDYELASNNGGWQWAAGTGCDAVPYFRIFNPLLQQEKFDPDFEFIKKYIPEWGTKAYPDPIIEHKLARERTLTAYKKAMS